MTNKQSRKDLSWKMIKIINDNILNSTENIICHQVNCKGIMESGLAKQIKYRYPMFTKNTRIIV